MIKAEWNYLRKHKLVLAVLSVIMLIPTIYAVTFLSSMWNPYGKMNKLPVAVVNQDKSVQYNKKKIAIGKQLTNKLGKSDVLDFHILKSEKKANDDLKKGKYYMIVTFPDNFSKNAVSLMDKKPQKMVVHYRTTAGNSFTASKLTQGVAKALAQNVSTQITKMYSEIMFNSIKTLGKGMSKSGVGNEKLAEGTSKLTEGNAKITSSLNKLAASSLTFSNGTSSLNEGLNNYIKGVSQLETGSAKVTTGLNQVNNQLPSLTNGVSKLTNGSTKLAAGMTQYTTGVSKVNNGAVALNNGAQKLDGAGNGLTSGISKLSQGAVKLTDGVQSYTEGTSKAYSGSQKIATGLNQLDIALNSNTSKNKVQQLKAGLSKFESGLEQLKTSVDNNTQNNGAVDMLTTSMKSLASELTVMTTYENSINTKVEKVAAEQNLTSQQTAAIESALAPDQDVKNALSSANSNLKNLQTQLGTLSTNPTSVTSLKNGIAQLQSSYGTSSDSANANTIYGGLNSLTDSISVAGTGVSKLNEGSATLTTGLSSLNGQSNNLINGANQLSTGLGSLSAQVPQLTNGISALASGSQKLSNGTSQLVSNGSQLSVGATQVSNGLGTLSTQVPTLTTGISKLAAGSQTITGGLGKLAANSSKLTSGTAQLGAGAEKINAGASKLSAGSGQLGTALTKVQKGNQTLGSKMQDAGEKVGQLNVSKLTYSQVAKPVTTKHKDTDRTPNNGTGMTPYMLSVYLFVGTLSLSMMFDLVTPRKYPKNGTEWWLGKMSVVGTFAVLQAVCAYFALIIFLGLSPVHLWAGLLTAIVASFAFCSIITFFVVSFGSIGSFFGLLIMVFQLAGSGGAYPIQLSNRFFEAIHPFLPITYSIHGLRETVSIGGTAMPDILVLLIIAVAFAVLAMVSYRMKMKNLDENMIETLSDEKEIKV